jgi:uncharacterized protein involved in exopolysaccharide biosynthesis
VSSEEIQTLLPRGEELHMIILTMIHAVDTRPAVEEAIRRLGLRLEPAELLDNLSVEPVENTSYIVLSYKDTDPTRA